MFVYFDTATNIAHSIYHSFFGIQNKCDRDAQIVATFATKQNNKQPFCFYYRLLSLNAICFFFQMQFFFRIHPPSFSPLHIYLLFWQEHWPKRLMCTNRCQKANFSYGHTSSISHRCHTNDFISWYLLLEITQKSSCFQLNRS